MNAGNSAEASYLLARATLGGQFPGREVVGINCTDSIWGLGALHCMTQRQPA
jgi:agmatine deiminase